MNMLQIDTWPLWLILVVFISAAAVIALVGIRMTRVADKLADITGLGEAIFGAVFLGGSTSLPGIVTSVTTAFQGYAELSVSNAVGGIAAQTTFLAIADICHRKVNLEHAAASVENLVQGALLVTLLAIPLLASTTPEITFWHIHPATPILVAGYIGGLRLVSKARSYPLWNPENTRETKVDEPEQKNVQQYNATIIWAQFILFAAIIATAGFLVAETGIGIADRTGMSQTVVGGLFTAVATSLPELVTSVAAVRQGALTLAVGDIIGGNSFDVLFLAVSDMSYRSGSIYHAITDREVFIISLTILLTGILLLGLLRREKHGIGNIGFESFMVIVIYLGAFSLLLLTQ
ncbi:MAG: hypothetical protein WBB23_04295 [Desulforhopalus sp.]